MIYQLVEPAARAFDTLHQFQVNGTAMSPDTYYNLILAITNDEKQSRNAQAELMLAQMPD